MYTNTTMTRTLLLGTLLAGCGVAGTRALLAQGTAVPAGAWGAAPFTMPSDAELKRRLTAEQYAVTQEAETETPFHNEFWDNHEAGIYVDVVSGEPLFSSLDKFDSHTGWPSFTRPLVSANIRKQEDHSYGMDRDEVRSVHANSHLGHLFDDGPMPTGLRYCINSAALRFVPVSKLASEGYGDFVHLFAVNVR